MSTRIENYKIGWISAIETEYVVACELLDEEYEADKVPKVDPKDENLYHFGRIGKHNIVIACLPKGRYGLTSAAIVAERMKQSFSALRFGLLVGIAGGAPSEKHDVRLGDVVISVPTPSQPGVIQYDFGKAIENHEFKETGSLAPPPDILLTALSNISAQHKRKGHKIAEAIQSMLDKNKRLRSDYRRPDIQTDKLYETIDGREQLVVRRNRSADEDDPVIHYGLIASASRLMKDRITRNALMAKYEDILCFEMEAAGLMNTFPCLVIRGICDYSDSYKNDIWQGYAAATATAYAKELLQIIPCQDVQDSQTINEGDEVDYPARKRVRHDNHTDTLTNTTNHGISANIVYGGIHQHHGLASNVLPQSNSLDAMKSTQNIDRADMIIRDYYTSSDRLKIIRLSGQRLSLEKCYINLSIVNRADVKQNEVAKLPCSLETRLRIEARNPDQVISLQELFKSRKAASSSITIEPRRIYIEGRAGVGKTTLCKKIVHEFLEHKLGTGLFDRLLWIPLRQLKSKANQENYKWLDLLKDTYSPQCDDWEEVATAISKHLYDKEYLRKSLFLFDGLDEISSDWRQGDPMYEFLAATICDLPNVIMTSRPQANTFHIGEFDLELETLGFSPVQIDAYVENCVQNSETAKKMKTMIARKPIMRGLLRIPVQLDAFCCVWSSGTTFDGVGELSPADGGLSNVSEPEDFSTMTTLYQAIITELCRKDLGHLKKELRLGRLDAFDIENHLKVELDVLCELAFQGLVNNVITFSPLHRDIVRRHLFQKHSNYKTLDLEKLSFLRTSDIELDPSKSNYHFLHLTFQEYFAAKHFVRHWRTDTDLESLDLVVTSYKNGKKVSSAKFLQNKKYDPRFNIFWRFVTGLIQSQPDEQIEGEVLKECDYASKDIIVFFDELHKKPVDLLGFTHCRLLMYCFSELLPCHAQELKELWESEKRLLRRGIIREALTKYHYNIGLEAEFPEDILREFLCNEGQLYYLRIMNILSFRRVVTAETWKLVSEKMRTSFTGRTLKDAIRFCHLNIFRCTPDIQIHILTSLTMIVKDKAKNVEFRRSALFKSYITEILPKEIVEYFCNALIDVLNDEDDNEEVRRSVAESLISYALDIQDDSANLVVDSLICVLKNTYEAVQLRRSVASSLGKYALKAKSGSVNLVVDSLIDAFKNKDEDVKLRRIVARSLNIWASKVENGSVNLTVDFLIDCFKNKDEDVYVRNCIAESLISYASHVQDDSANLVVELLINVLSDKNEVAEVRGVAAERLGSLPVLSEESFIGLRISALTGILKDKQESVRVRRGAVKGLTRQSCLQLKASINPQNNVLNNILKDKDEDNDVRYSILSDIDSCYGSNQVEYLLIDILIDILKDERERKNVRHGVIWVLRRMSSLPQPATNVLIDLFENSDEDRHIRMSAARALRERQAPVQEAIDRQISFLLDVLENSVGDFDRSEAASALGDCPSLPPEAVNCLVDILIQGKNEFSIRQDLVRKLLMQQAFLSKEALLTLIKALVHVFENQDENVYDVLHQHGIYTLIPSLEDHDWQRLCFSWFAYGHMYQISCYEYEDSFYVWVGGKLYTYPATLPRTPALIWIMLETREQYLSSNLHLQVEDKGNP